MARSRCVLRPAGLDETDATPRWANACSRGRHDAAVASTGGSREVATHDQITCRRWLCEFLYASRGNAATALARSHEPPFYAKGYSASSSMRWREQSKGSAEQAF